VATILAWRRRRMVSLKVSGDESRRNEFAHLAMTAG